MILGDENLFVMGKNQWHCKRIRERDFLFFEFSMWREKERKRKTKCFKRVLQMLKGTEPELISTLKKFSANRRADHNNAILRLNLSFDKINKTYKRTRLI